MKKKIYCGMCIIPSLEDNKYEFKFSLSPITVIDEYDDIVELPTYYFVSSMESTKFLDTRHFDHELCVTDEMKLFYSRSKKLCLSWLNATRSKLISTYNRAYDSLLKSSVVEEDEYNG